MEPKQQPPYPLRMSPELRARLEGHAELTRRSLNAEITDRLERSFTGSDGTDLGMKSLGVALARAEQSVAVAEIQAEGRLFSAASLAIIFMNIMGELDRRGIELEASAESIKEAYETAYRFMRDADHQAESGSLDALIKRSERSELRLLEAQAELRKAAGRKQGTKDLPPERTVTHKGSSGVARKIAITTKASRGAKGE